MFCVGMFVVKATSQLGELDAIVSGEGCFPEITGGRWLKDDRVKGDGCVVKCFGSFARS